MPISVDPMTFGTDVTHWWSMLTAKTFSPANTGMLPIKLGEV